MNEYKLDGDYVIQIHNTEYGELREIVFERPEYDPNGDLVAESERFWIKNATAIVRACNSHDDLLAACKRMHKWLEGWTGEFGTSDLEAMMIDEIEAAIAKAKAEE